MAVPVREDAVREDAVRELAGQIHRSTYLSMAPPADLAELLDRGWVGGAGLAA